MVEHRSGHKDIFFQGYARVLKDQVDNALAKSGTKGLFLETLASEADKKPVRWESLEDEKETPAHYFARIAAMAENEGKPMAWRKGGGSCLGLRFNHSDDLPATLATYTCHGVPRCWRRGDLESILVSAGWTQVQVLMEPRRRLRPNE